MNKLIQAIQLADKYSRLKQDGTKESWPEVVDRVVAFFVSELKKQQRIIPPEWITMIKDEMLSMNVLPSMRVVQMAGPSLERDHVGVYNCFTGDTRFVTRQGNKSFSELYGKIVDVLTENGDWKPAVVKTYGHQDVFAITFRPGHKSRTSIRKIVKATRDHGWVTTRGKIRDLQIGDEVIANELIEDFSVTDWVRGFGFGDGTVQHSCARVRLCGAKAKYLPNFLATNCRVSYSPSNNGDPLVSWESGMFSDWKNLPETPSPSWLAGYMAADGTTDQSIQPSISTIREDVAEYLQTHAAQLGICVTGINYLTQPTNFGERSSRLIRIGIRPAKDVVWRVMDIQPVGRELVYCVEEPTTHTFTLEHGLLTQNCAYLALDRPSSLGELLHIMMQGTGVGFSVESRYVDLWPTVAVQKRWPPHKPQVHVITDSTEGWVEAFNLCIKEAIDGYEQEFDYSRIRPAGSPLHTKGGYASGPDPLRDLLVFTTNIIRGAAGRKLRPFEVHRIATKAGSVVMVGGVRRAAQISLSDAEDHELRDCKSGSFWIHYPELSMANNSGVFTSKDQVSSEWPFLKASGTGERGLFNPDGPIPVRRNWADFGTNPCGEVLLRSRQFCNLSIAVARPTDTREDLIRKVRVATIVGTLQSCLTYFPNLPREWKSNCEEERLLGVDITGTLDCPLLQSVNQSTMDLLDMLKAEARYTNEMCARLLGIKSSVAITCNKPSGNSSQLLDCSSGIHPRYAKYYIRRLRIGKDTPLAKHLVDMNIPVFPEVGFESLDESQVWVFELPAKSPDNAVVRSDMTAIQQLEYWKMWKLYWTEHNPSCTIYVGEDEWDIVHQWVRDHWGIIGGLSFLPRDNHIYRLAPYEEINERQFFERAIKIKWDGQSLTAWGGSEAGTTDSACEGDFCAF